MRVVRREGKLLMTSEAMREEMRDGSAGYVWIVNGPEEIRILKRPKSLKHRIDHVKMKYRQNLIWL